METKNKKPLSRNNYIHNNKNTITIGIIGEEKTTFKKKNLFEDINKIQAKSIKLSNDFSKNTKFPTFFGKNGEATILVSKARNQINDILNNRTFTMSPLNTRETLIDLKETAENEKAFNNKFSYFVNQYYGTNYSTERTFKELEKGSFKYIPQDVGKDRQGSESDPSRFQKWFTEHDGVSRKKIKKITDISELNRLAQELEQTGEVPEEIAAKEM